MYRSAADKNESHSEALSQFLVISSMYDIDIVQVHPVRVHTWASVGNLVCSSYIHIPRPLEKHL